MASATCTAVVKSGPRKGSQCNKGANYNGFCFHHAPREAIASLPLVEREEKEKEEEIDKTKAISCGTCVICLDYCSINSVRVVMPCGHVCVCAGCEAVVHASGLCPMCRSAVTSINKLFFPAIPDEKEVEKKKVEDGGGFKKMWIRFKNCFKRK